MNTGHELKKKIHGLLYAFRHIHSVLEIETDLTHQGRHDRFVVCSTECCKCSKTKPTRPGRQLNGTLKQPTARKITKNETYEATLLLTSRRHRRVWLCMLMNKKPCTEASSKTLLHHDDSSIKT